MRHRQRVVHPRSRLPALLAVAAVAALHAIMPGEFSFGPTLFVPLALLALVVPLTAAVRLGRTRGLRLIALVLLVVIFAVNLATLVRVIAALLERTSGGANGRDLLLAAAIVWLANVFGFAIGYWEIDSGGPHARVTDEYAAPDFQFPQQVAPSSSWTPGFGDYLYVAFTNGMAFSPTDALPLTGRAKSLMLAQSLASIVTIVLVTARAVNILN